MREEELTFEALATRESCATTLAYWIGTLTRAGFALVEHAEPITIAMALQYDLEQQAGGTGVLFPEGADWRGAFLPVAPVQLADRWSPFPDAAEALGPPSLRVMGLDTFGSRCVVMAWSPDAIVTAPLRATPARGDRQRLRGLLEVSVMRARERDLGVLLAGKPGWSYADAYPMTRQTAARMRRAGFVVTDRHV